MSLEHPKMSHEGKNCERPLAVLRLQPILPHECTPSATATHQRVQAAKSPQTHHDTTTCPHGKAFCKSLIALCPYNPSVPLLTLARTLNIFLHIGDEVVKSLLLECLRAKINNQTINSVQFSSCASPRNLQRPSPTSGAALRNGYRRQDTITISAST